MNNQMAKQVEEAKRIQEDLANQQQSEEDAPSIPVDKEDPGVTVEDADSSEDNPVQEEGTFKEKDNIESSGEDWEQKYKVLQGKYNAEVTADVASLREQVNSLVDENQRISQNLQSAAGTIDNLNSIIASKPDEVVGHESNTEVSSVDKPSGVIDPNDFEVYGEEMVSLVDKFNEQAKTIELLQSSTQGLSQQQSKSAEKDFYKQLAVGVPEWESINTNPGFLKWLGDIDPASGATRMDLLQRHYNNLNIQGVEHFFKTWVSLNTAPEAPAKTKDADKGGQGGQVMPSNSGAGYKPKETVKITRKEMAQASVDFSRGSITSDQYTKISTAFQESIIANGGKL